MTPEAPTVAPAFTPQRRTLSLARHWIDTGRGDRVLGAVQLLLESDSPKLLVEARDLLGLLIDQVSAAPPQG